MSSEIHDVVLRAREWLTVADTSRDAVIRRRAAAPSAALDISSHVAELLDANVANETVLAEVGDLFDRVAECGFDCDVFGERYEIAATLAYLGWRTCYRLSLEKEALSWIEALDFIVREDSTEFQRLEYFLYLPEGVTRRYEVFLPAEVDLFLALAVLRRDRLARPLQVVAAAIGIYQWLTVSARDQRSPDFAYLRAESAYLAAAGLRMLGRHKECHPWLGIAKRERRQMICSAAARTRLHLITVLMNREQHRYRSMLARFEALIDRCRRLGLNREMVVARFADAVVERVLGRESACLAKLNVLVQETENTVHSSIRGLCLSQMAGILAQRGLLSEAEQFFSEALESVAPSEDRLSFASVLMQLGETQLSCGRLEVAAHIFRLASNHFARVGSSYYRAFSEVLAADAFADVGLWGDAIKSLAVAFPLIKRESMTAEWVHSLKILNTIVSKSGFQSGKLDELLADFHGGLIE